MICTVIGGSFVSPVLTYCTACPAKRLLSCELLHKNTQAAPASGILLNVHTTLTSSKSHKEGRGRLSSMTAP